MNNYKDELKSLLNKIEIERMDNYYDKLRALLEGLEIENIEHLLSNGDVDTYRLLGKMIALKTKELK